MFRGGSGQRCISTISLQYLDLEVRKFQGPFDHETCTGDELGEIKKALGPRRESTLKAVAVSG